MSAPTTLETHSYYSADMTDAEPLHVGPGDAVVYSRAHPVRGGPNQDAAIVIALPEQRCVLAVADGMGGLPSGDQAAATALRTLAATITASHADGSHLRGAILDGIEAANRAVIEKVSGSGTTLVAVSVNGDAIRSYHVGDSAVLLVGQRGKLKHATIAHSPTGYAVEAGLLDADEAIVHEDRHLISNMLGSREMKIEVGPRLLMAPRDTLLLASDGVLDNMRQPEITDAIRKGKLPDVARAVAASCVERMAQTGDDHPCKPDDATFILFRRSV